MAEYQISPEGGAGNFNNGINTGLHGGASLGGADPATSNIAQYANQLLGGDSGQGLTNRDHQYIVNNITTQSGEPLAVRDHFLKLLDNWEFSLPLNQLWMVFFDIPAAISNEMMGAWGEHIIPVGGSNSINLARDRFLAGDKYTRFIGCAFAQTVTLPQEQNAIVKVGPSNRGFLKAPVLQQRQSFASINIEFLESNLSFVDFLIRPWIVATSHYGYVARPDVDLTTDIVVINFAKGGADFDFAPYAPARDNGSSTDNVMLRNRRGFVPRKMFLYSGCTPINMRPERYGYTPEAGVDRRDTEWTFRRYQVLTPSMFDEVMDTYQNNEEANQRTFWANHMRRREMEATQFDNAADTINQQLNADERRIHQQYIAAEEQGRVNVGRRTGSRPGGPFDILNFLGL